jgi:predicted dehydrogenase
MRLGFLGTGWIGRHRMEAIGRSGLAEIAAIADPCGDSLAAALRAAPSARVAASLEDLLELGLDGLVIATPSALHAEQAIAALEAGTAVFCQKPVGRTAAETRRVVEAARRADRLLGADFSYRLVEGVRRIRELVGDGELGTVYAIDLVFHNAYGPDKAWFYDPALSGGGCVIDLGIHLVDLALWLLDFPQLAEIRSQLYSRGHPVTGRRSVEDFAAATLTTRDGALIRLACSWNLPAGRDAVIRAELIGTAGSASLENLDGSFYDFVAERRRGTVREMLCGPPDEWGGRAAVAWAARLARDARYDPEAERLVTVAEVIDRIYGEPAETRRAERGLALAGGSAQ